MSAYLIVPSDITVLENKMCNGKRGLSFMESVGLMGIFPLYHNSFSKLSRSEMKDVLTKKYTADGPEAEICKTRQAAVSRQVCSHVHNYVCAGTMGFATFWSLRLYNYQAKCMFVPLIAYAGSWVGRFVGDIATGRNGETYRERYLATLPAKIYYPGGEA